MKKNTRTKPATQEDIQGLRHDFGEIRKQTKNDFEEMRKQTKNDLDDAVAQIVQVVSKTLEEYPTKEDLNGVEQRLSNKIDKVSYDVSDLRNRVIDLEIKHGAPHAHTA